MFWCLNCYWQSGNPSSINDPLNTFLVAKSIGCFLNESCNLQCFDFLKLKYQKSSYYP